MRDRERTKTQTYRKFRNLQTRYKDFRSKLLSCEVQGAVSNKLKMKK